MVIATLSAWLAGPEQASLRRSIASWISRLRERESPRLAIPDVLSLLEDETMGERFQRKYATWEDAIEDRGRQMGLEKGREEGREEGRAQGMRAVLKKLLAGRFGELPAVAAARIDQAGEAQVDRWIDAVLVAESVEALLRK
jgi:predicted transposase YdaD